LASEFLKEMLALKMARPGSTAVKARWLADWCWFCQCWDKKSKVLVAEASLQ